MSDTAKRLEVLFELKRYDELLQISIPLCASSSDDQITAYHYTILAWLRLEKLENAHACILEALAHFPLEVHFLYFKAFTLFKQNRFKEALCEVKILLSKEPHKGVYHHLHAQILVELSLYVDAKRAIDTALALDAHEADFLVTLALITYYLENKPIACEIIDAILSNNPHHAGALHLRSILCTSSLCETRKILQGILFHNPFDEEGKERLESIKRYYTIAPVLMITFLLYALGERLEMWEKSSHTSGILLLVSLYIWRDWRLSFPFFILCFALLGEVRWDEWYVVGIGAVIYYLLGRIGGQLLGVIMDKAKELIRKGKRWMNR